MLNEFLKELGFEDITKEYPIAFSETIIGPDNIYPVNKRFRKQTDDIITTLLIGEDRIRTFVIGMQRFAYKPCYCKFQCEVIKDYAKQTIIYYLQASERKLNDLTNYINNTK